ncbi:2,3-bisphosphoglycerate-independent phosphoglycerate mutase [Pseudomonadota bacterium]
MPRKPILLCILDGWGIGDNSSSFNAIAVAKTPNYDRFLKQYPSSKLSASGEDAGLPRCQIGNSEVGHMNIGAGRIVCQDLPKINKDIEIGGLKTNQTLQDLIRKLKKNGGTCHLLGLLSEGGVHSHQDQILEIAKEVARNGINVKIHAFLDGRDVPQKSAIGYIEKFESDVKEFCEKSKNTKIKIATVSGRYYSMDRDKRWNRTEKAYNVMILGEGRVFDSAIEGVQTSYDQGITDEFVEPFIIGSSDYNTMKDGDGLLVANFRVDRIRQILDALTNNQFKEFKRKKIINFTGTVSITECSKSLNEFCKIMYLPEDIKNSLGEVLAQNGLRQLRLAETEKYAHVTFFFSGGRESKFDGEERILVQSPNVATYDLKPEMSAYEVQNKLIEAINSDKFDFIIVNFANPDMVGHTGVMNAAIKAAEVIDEIIGNIEKIVKEKDWIMLLTADHGNLENMFDDIKKQPCTAHSTNLVPFILVGNDIGGYRLKDGKLSNIAPTILKLMGIKKPKEMNESGLLV